MLHYNNAYIPMYGCKNMPTLTIYLTNELYDKVKSSPSKIVRAALENYFNKRSTNHEENKEEENQTSTNS